ncbi:uridylate kinase [Methylocystis sp. 9N]|uniref:Uridylate kinase n=1 Tax=Methylocystis borbori TaxID=3118750 RepID=A0ABU7XD15_9HYPH
MPSNSERSAPAPLVVKLGGSLHASPARAQWIAALRRYPHPLTIVAGGGPFADAVRAAQPPMGFDDSAAHAMAVLAMEQYALALANLHEGLELAASLEAIADAHAKGRIALWRAGAMVAEARDIAPGWETTSDSLAAWLARKTDAHALLVVKSVDVRDGASLADILRMGVVDSAFPAYLDGTPLHVAGPAALTGAARLLGEGALPGARIEPSMQKIAS